MELIPSSYSGSTLEGYLTKVSLRSRIIYWIIIFTSLLVISLLPFIYVDVTVQARGYFQSDTEKQFIYAPSQGVVHYSNIGNGTVVKAGDTLVVLESVSLNAQYNSLLRKKIENQNAIHDLKIIEQLRLSDKDIPENSFRTPRYYSEYLRLMNLKRIAENRLKKARTDLDRKTVLHNDKLISDSEFEEVLFSYETEKESLDQVLNSEITRWSTDLAERKDIEITLDAEIASCAEQTKNRTIISPINGEIISSIEIQNGTILSLNQIVAQITPDDTVIATCYLRPGDIGLVHEGQKVLIQVDALNFNEWGFVHAEIKDISADILNDNSTEGYFRISCIPLETELTLSNGASVRLKKGMSINARIIVNRRSLFSLLFDKIDKWVNPYSFKKT